MPVTGNTIRLFISSTFSDFRAERDILQRHVFPKLRQLCLSKGLRFQAIDLRWGVSEEEGKHNETMRICLRELARCQRSVIKPNFIVLLGDRYGWRPLPPAIRADLFEAISRRIARTDAAAASILATWYRRDDNAVPPHHVLLPRTGRFETLTIWESEVERVLLPALAAASQDLSMDPETSSPLRQALKETPISLSATHQEIIRGALNMDDPRREHVHAFFRTIRYAVAQRPHKDFIDLLPDGAPDVGAARHLDSLRGDLEAALGRQGDVGSNVHGYAVDWREDGAFDDEDLEGFKQSVLTALTAVIEQQAAALPIEKQEERAHRDFAQERRRGFVGRREALDRAASLLADGAGHLVAVTGPGGSGKSAFVAEVAERARQSHPDALLIERYIGATPGSSDLITLLRDIIGTIRDRHRTGLFAASNSPSSQDQAIPTQLTPLIIAFQDVLHQTRTDAPLFLFIDGLDQLSDLHQARQLHWLPRAIPSHVCLMVSAATPVTAKAPSSLKGPRRDVLDSTRATASSPRAATPWPSLQALIPPADRIVLEALTVDDGAEMLERWLKEAGRTLQPIQRDQLLEAFATEGSPLWLRTASNEASRLASWQPSPAWAPTTHGLLNQLLMRLSREEEHGATLVYRMLSYMACARHGLAEDEMLDVLSADGEVMGDFRRRSPNSPHVESLPAAVWVRLLGDIDPYLKEVAADGATLLTFYDRSLRDAVTASPDENGSGAELHGRLARYFSGSGESMPFEVPGPDQAHQPHLRRLSEYPYHLLLARQWPAFRAALADVGFARAIRAAGRDFDYISLHDAAIEAVKGSDDIGLVFSLALDRVRLSQSLDPDFAVQRRLGLTEARNWQPPASKTSSKEFTIIYVPPEEQAEFDSVIEFLKIARSNGYALLRLSSQDAIAARQAFSHQLSTVAMVSDQSMRWRLVKDLLVISVDVIDPEYIAEALNGCVQFVYESYPDGYHAKMVQLLPVIGKQFFGLAAWHAVAVTDAGLRAAIGLELACATASDIAIGDLRSLLAQCLPAHLMIMADPDDALCRRSLSILERLPAAEGQTLLTECVALLADKPERAAAVAAGSWPVEGCTPSWCSVIWGALVAALPAKAAEGVAMAVWKKYRARWDAQGEHLAAAFRHLLGPLENAMVEGADTSDLIACINFLHKLELAPGLDRLVARVVNDLDGWAVSSVGRDRAATVMRALGGASAAVALRHTQTLVEKLLAHGGQRDQDLSLLQLNRALSETASSSILAGAAELEFTQISRSRPGSEMASEIAASIAVMAATGATEEAEREESFRFACGIARQVQDSDALAALRAIVLHCVRLTVHSAGVLAAVREMAPDPASAAPPDVLFGLELAKLLAEASLMDEARLCWRQACAKAQAMTPPAAGGLDRYEEDCQKDAALRQAMDLAAAFPGLDTDAALPSWLDAWTKFPGHFESEWKRLNRQPTTVRVAPVSRDWQGELSKAASTWREKLACLREVLCPGTDPHLPIAVLTHIWQVERDALAGMKGRAEWSPATRAACMKQVASLHPCRPPTWDPWADLCTEGLPNWPYLEHESGEESDVGVPDSCLFAFVMREVPQPAWDDFVADFLAAAHRLPLEAVDCDCLVALSYLLVARKTPQDMKARFLDLLRYTFTQPAIPASILSWLSLSGHSGAKAALRRAVESRVCDHGGGLTTVHAFIASTDNPSQDAPARRWLKHVASKGSGDFAAEAALHRCRACLIDDPSRAGEWFSLAIDLLPMMARGQGYLKTLLALIRLAGLPSMPAASIDLLVEEAIGFPRVTERTKEDWFSSKEKLRAGVLIAACRAILQRRDGPLARDWMRRLLEAAQTSAVRRIDVKHEVMKLIHDPGMDPDDYAAQVFRLRPDLVREYETLTDEQRRASAIECFWEAHLAFAAAGIARQMKALYPDLAAASDEVIVYGQKMAACSSEGCEDIALYWRMVGRPSRPSGTALSRLNRVLEDMASLAASRIDRRIAIWPALCREFVTEALGEEGPKIGSSLRKHVEQWGLRPISDSGRQPMDVFLCLGADRAAAESALMGSAIALSGHPDRLADWLSDSLLRMPPDKEGAARPILALCALEVETVSLRLLQAVSDKGGYDSALAFARSWTAKNGEMDVDLRRYLLARACCGAANVGMEAFMAVAAEAVGEWPAGTLTPSESEVIQHELMSMLTADDPTSSGQLMAAICDVYQCDKGGG